MNTDQKTRLGVPATVLKHSDLTESVLGVFYKVYNELGYGFLESVYEKALQIALEEAGFSVDAQISIPVWYHGHQIGDFKADLVVNRILLLELKSARRLESAHEAQTLNYLKATEIEVALVLNFGPRPEFRRLLFDNDRKKHRETAAGAGK